MKKELGSRPEVKGPSKEQRKLMAAGFRFNDNLPTPILKESYMTLMTSTNKLKSN